MNEKERFIAALKLEIIDRVPCASPLQTATVDLMKITGVYLQDAHTDARLMAKLAKAAHDIVGIESVRVPFDMTVDASAFGAIIGKGTNIMPPSVIKPPINTVDDADKLDIPDPYRDGRTPIVLEALRILSGEVRDTPLICAVTSAFTLAAQLMGEEKAIMNVLRDQYFLERVLKKCTYWGMEYSKAAIEAGADVIVMIDGTSSNSILGPEQYVRFALPCQKDIANSIREYGAYSILHVCGDITENARYLSDTGAMGISIDQQMDISWVKQQLNGRCAVIGNVSPTTTLWRGTPMDVEKEAIGCIMKGTDILAPGCGFVPGTPLENMRALVQSALKWGRRES